MRVRVDILNVSKLNMGMLLIERRPFLVTEQLSDVLRVFSVYVPPPSTLEYTTDDSVSRSECGEKDIALSLKVDESVVALKAQCIVADSSRLLQIIINCKLVSPLPVLPLTVCPQSSQTPSNTRLTLKCARSSSTPTRTKLLLRLKRTHYVSPSQK